MSADHGREHLVLGGRVQGVGLRPFAWRLARELGLAGHVSNCGGEVHLELEGPAAARAEFQRRLLADAPAPCMLRDCQGVEPRGEPDFQVIPGTVAEAASFLPLHDVAPCEDCRRELADPADRRHRYPFIACSRCGPRLTVTQRLPWARANTTMAAFPLCAACAREFADPADRRFHAEMTACPDCGPQLAWAGTNTPAAEVAATGTAALAAAVACLQAGGILMLKGVGGYQLLCDATDAHAVTRLRARKRRPRKPFAVLVADLAAAARLASLEPAEAQALAGPAAPIVLTRARNGPPLADGIHPGLAWLGLMLPASPLHLLLAEAVGGPLVCTSANLAGEPLCRDDAEARAAVGALADGWLSHDRAIALPCDDPVVRIIDGRPVTLRVGRGLAPQVIALPAALPPSPPLVGTGGHLKAAVALARGHEALLGPHVGDLDTPASRARHAQVAEQLCRLYHHTPAQTAHDRHPDDAGAALARRLGTAPPLAVQHHHAHALACAAEHGYTGPLLAVCWDGTGAGDDGTVWGGEWLAIDGAQARRMAWLMPLRLVGGEAAIRDPRRVAIALLAAAGCPTPWPALPEERRPLATEALTALLDRPSAGPLCSSAGRLLDGLAVLCGLIGTASFDGEAVMRLESALPAGVALPAPPADARLGLVPANSGLTLDWRGLVRRVVTARTEGSEAPALAALVHGALVAAIVEVAGRLDMPTVALGGGCFQNRALVEGARRGLEAAGHQVLVAGRIPPNDGGLALGQVVAAGRALAASAGGH